MINKVAIVIPVHNGLEYTRHCVATLKERIAPLNKQKNIQYSLIVIDDGSSDGTADWIVTNHPDIILLKGDGSLWWSGGVTKGARHALEALHYNWILLWNNDVVPDDNYFLKLSKLIQTSEGDEIIGSKVCDLSDPNKIWSMGGFYNPKTGRKYMLGLDKSVGNNSNDPIECDWLTGMGTLIPQKVFHRIGYWNSKDFPQYFGDTDFTYRAKKHGFRLIVDPRLVLYNDTENTGFIHQGSLKKLIQSLVSIRSKYNLQKELKFYQLHAKSPLAYIHILSKYTRYIGGFFKWKILGLLGIQKMQSN
jgi:GT2 family glycosyltransferase